MPAAAAPMQPVVETRLPVVVSPIIPMSNRAGHGGGPVQAASLGSGRGGNPAGGTPDASKVPVVASPVVVPPARIVPPGPGSDAIRLPVVASPVVVPPARIAPPGAPPPQNTDYWQGGGGGNGDWNTPSDWQGDSVPAADDNAVFNLTGSYTVTGDATIQSIAVNQGSVTFDGSISEDSVGSGAFLSGGNDAQVTLDSNAFFYGGPISFADGTVLSVDGTLITTGGQADLLEVENFGQVITSGAITLNTLTVGLGGSYTGDLTLNEAGSLQLDTSASFGGGTLTLDGDASIYLAAAEGTSGGQGSVTDAIGLANGGTLQLGSDSGVTLLLGGPISGDGNLLVTSGIVDITGTGNTYTGSTSVENATLIVDNSTGVASPRILLTDATLISGAAGNGYSGAVIAFGTADTIDAAAGNILAYMGAAGGTLSFAGGSGVDTVIAGDSVTLNMSGGGNNWGVAYGAGSVVNAYSTTGTDTLLGGAGSNVILTGAGTDYVIPGTGDETIYASTGTMDVIASGGSSAFALDYVNGFGGGFTNCVGFSSQDTIALYNYGAGAGQNVLNGAEVVNGNTVLHLTDNTTVVLFGYTDLTAGQIVSV
jgi:hypothetical protein